jgi:glycosyltransferase involved in cell wall biosynthesis
MKVAIVSDYPSSGGAKEFTLSLIRLLMKKRLEIYLLITETQNTKEIRDLCGEKIKIVPYIYRNVNIFGKSSNFPNTVLSDLFSLKKILKVKPDMLIISSTFPGKYLELSMFFKETYYFLHTVPERRMSIIPRLLLSTCLFNKLTIITVSKFSKEKINKLWGVSSVEVIPNGVRNIKNKNNNKKRKTILTMGHVTIYKNPFTWIKVAKMIIKKHPQIEFVWCGEGDLYEKCVDIVKNYKNIRFVGLVNNKKKYFHQAVLYYQPSIIESQGIAILEAMSFGLPIVASNVGGIPESVTNNSNGYLVAPNNVTETTEKIDILLSSKALRTRMGIKSKKSAATFSNKNWERKILNTLQINE